MTSGLRPSSGAVRDWHREVHIPYYVPGKTLARPRREAQRERDFGFVGSLCCGRGWLKELLRPGNCRGLPSECHRITIGMPSGCHRSAIGVPSDRHRIAIGLLSDHLG